LIGLLEIWTICDHPSDHPDGFTVRKHIVGRGVSGPTQEMFVAPTLDEARALLPPGLMCVGREPDDDPVIVESWM
jgi:hypothetical protein